MMEGDIVTLLARGALCAAIEFWDHRAILSVEPAVVYAVV